MDTKKNRDNSELVNSDSLRCSALVYIALMLPSGGETGQSQIKQMYRPQV